MIILTQKNGRNHENMGFSSASYIMDEIISGLEPLIKNAELRKDVYIKIILALENADWDNLEECFGQDIVYDKAVKIIHPEYEFEED